MADLYEDYGLEIESDNFGADPDLTPKKPTVVKKGGVLGKVVALLLGFVIGAGGVIGGVVGAGYYVVSKPVKETVGTVNNLTGLGINYADFITEEYASKTVIQLVGVVGEVAAKFGSGAGTLGDLNNISPVVGKALDPVLETVSGYGLNLDKEELMATPVGELPAYLAEEAKAIELNAILNSLSVAQTPILEAICFDEDGNAVTIGDIMDGGPEALLANVPLEALLISEDGVVDPEKDSLIMALAYGNTNRYELDSESKVVMKQMEYSLIDGVLYDINHEKVLNAVLGANGIYTITDGDELYYAAPTAFARSTVIPYYAYKDEACTTPLAYKKTMVSDLMGGEASDLFNNLELGTLFNISPLDEDPDPITLALAYGEEGTHYEIVNNTIVWIGDNKPKTIGTLLEGELTSIIYELKLGTLLDISPLDKYTKAEGEKDPDPLMLALAYGEEGTHYEVVQKNGEYVIEWKVKEVKEDITYYYSARTIEDLTTNAEGIFNDIQISTVLNVKIDDSEADPMTHALAFGYENEHYKIEDGEIAWLEDENGDPYKPRTVKDLTNMTTVLEDLRLATVLGADPLDPTSADEMTLAIAYGYEGTHYEIEDGKLVWLDDENGDPYKPRTVADMSTMGNIINDIRLETALSVTHESPRLLHVLAYGSEGDGFNYVKDASDKVIGIEVLKYNTVSSLSSKDNNLIDSLKLKDILGAEAIEDDLLLSHLGDETLESLPDAIEKLTFKQVYPEQIYVVRYVVYKNGEADPTILTYDEENDDYYYTEGMGTYRYPKSQVIIEYHFEIENASGDVIETGWIAKDDMYYENEYYHRVSDGAELHLELTSQWKYLLVGKDGETHDYKMTEFATLVENMTHNMQNATLYALDSDGIVDLTEDTLKAPIITEIKIQTGTDLNGDPIYKTVGSVNFTEVIKTNQPDGKPVLGDLTIKQIMSYTAAVLTALNSLNYNVGS